jgi:hypothetical protein
VGEDEGGTVGLLDDLGHGEGLAGAGDAEQDLMLFSGAEALHELVDGAGLVALGLVGGDQLKVHGEIIRREAKELSRGRRAKDTDHAGDRGCWNEHSRIHRAIEAETFLSSFEDVPSDRRAEML